MVLAGLYELCHIERCAEVAILRVSYELAVNPYIYVRRSGADVEHNVAA